jgi:hypothetical protein
LYVFDDDGNGYVIYKRIDVRKPFNCNLPNKFFVRRKHYLNIDARSFTRVEKKDENYSFNWSLGSSEPTIEIRGEKDIVLKLQSYTMDVNKTLLQERINVFSDLGVHANNENISFEDDFRFYLSGQIGCYLSHFSVIEKIMNEKNNNELKYDYSVIFEDDVTYIKPSNPIEEIKKM